MAALALRRRGAGPPLSTGFAARATGGRPVRRRPPRWAPRPRATPAGAQRAAATRSGARPGCRSSPDPSRGSRSCGSHTPRSAARCPLLLLPLLARRWPKFGAVQRSRAAPRLAAATETTRTCQRRRRSGQHRFRPQSAQGGVRGRGPSGPRRAPPSRATAQPPRGRMPTQAANKTRRRPVAEAAATVAPVPLVRCLRGVPQAPAAGAAAVGPEGGPLQQRETTTEEHRHGTKYSSRAHASLFLDDADERRSRNRSWNELGRSAWTLAS